jgi:hypothetical protein
LLIAVNIMSEKYSLKSLGFSDLVANFTPSKESMKAAQENARVAQEKATLVARNIGDQLSKSGFGGNEKRMSFCVLSATDSATMCAQCVGSSGLSFCTKGKASDDPEACSVAHRGEKLILEAGQGMFKHGPSSQALCYLTISAAQVESLGPEVTAKWRNQASQSEAAWRKQLENANLEPQAPIFEQNADSAPSIEGLGTLSPMKSLSEAEHVFEAKAEPLFSKADVAELSGSNLKREPGSSAPSAAERLTGIVQDTSDALTSVKVRMSEMEANYRGVRRNLGTASGRVAAAGGTIFSTLHSILETGDDRDSRLREEIQLNQERFAGLQRSHALTEDRARQLEEQGWSQAALVAVHGEILDGFEKALEVIAPKFNSMYDAFCDNAGSHVSQGMLSEGMIEAVAKAVLALKATKQHQPRAANDFASLFSDRNVGDPAVQQTSPPANDELLLEARQLLKKMEECEARVNRTNKVHDSAFAKYDNYSLDDWKEWSQKHIVQLQGSISWIMDVGAFLELALAKANPSDKKGGDLKTFIQLQAAGLRSHEELTIINSVEVELPKYLHKGVRNPKSPLSSIKTVDDFDDKALDKIGVKYDMIRGARKLEATMRSEINRLQSPEAQALALSLLNRNVAWVSGIIVYLTSSMDDLTARAGYTPKDAVMVTSTVVRQIFERIHSVKAPASGVLAIMAESRAEGAALLLSVTLKAQHEMADFHRCNYGDHPCVASELVNFLLRQNASAQSSGGSVKLDALSTKVEASKKESKRVHDTLAARVLALEKK